MFSIQPSQIKGESLVSFILRVSERNGFSSPSEWLDSQTWQAVVKNNLNPKHQKNIKTFIRNLRCPSKAITHSRRTVLFDELRISTPRICPKCVKQLGYLKESWQTINNLYCAEHATILIDCCPFCKSPIEWSHSLLSNQCHNQLCSQPYASNHFMPELKELFFDEICDCLLASLFVDKPFTTVLPHSRVPQFSNLNSSLMAGFSLLNHKRTFEKLIKELFGENSQWSNLPAKIQLFPVILLRNTLQCCWPFSEYVERIEFLKTDKSAFHYDQDVIVTVESALELLHISPLELKSLPEFKNKEITIT